MTNDERKQIVVNAINEYHAAKASGSREKMIRAINGMENTYIAVSLHAVDNTEVLRRLIIAAKEEIKNIITPADNIARLLNDDWHRRGVYKWDFMEDGTTPAPF